VRILRALLAGVFLAAPAMADDFEGEIPVDREATLRIALERGDVDVVTHELETVRLEARARGSGASAIHFEVREDAAGWVFESRAEPWLRWLNTGPCVNVRAWVPRAVALEIETPGRILTTDSGVSVALPARPAESPQAVAH
jgi:hypothetical protein